jgi:hypothetical protein
MIRVAAQASNRMASTVATVRPALLYMAASMDWMNRAVSSPKVSVSLSTTRPSAALLPNTREAMDTMTTMMGARLNAPK